VFAVCTPLEAWDVEKAFGVGRGREVLSELAGVIMRPISEYLRISQNISEYHRIAGVGRDLCGSSNNLF